MECCLHISYKLEILKWQARGEEDKASVANRKKKIQNDLRDQLGLVVDVPKSGGSGTSDGNTGRLFFQDYEKVCFNSWFR